jgi:hypothetical protein
LFSILSIARSNSSVRDPLDVGRGPPSAGIAGEMRASSAQNIAAYCEYFALV